MKCECYLLIDNLKCKSTGIAYSINNQHYPLTIIHLDNNTNYYNHPSISHGREDIKFISLDRLENINDISVVQLLQTFNSQLQADRCVIIDSINRLELLTSPNKCLQLIRDFIHNPHIRKLICIQHRDCSIPKSSILKHILHVADTCIAVKSLTNSGKYIVTVQKKLSSGKISNTEEELYYDPENKVWINVEIREPEKQRIVIPKASPHDIASFKISIDESAKAARNDMILPYTEASKGPAKIEYDEDKMFDWDDEDPDEDLDI